MSDLEQFVSIDRHLPTLKRNLFALAFPFASSKAGRFPFVHAVI